MKHCKRYDVPLMNFRNITIKKAQFLVPSRILNLLNENNYLNIAKTKSNERGAGSAKCACPVCDRVCERSGDGVSHSTHGVSDTHA